MCFDNLPSHTHKLLNNIIYKQDKSTQLTITIVSIGLLLLLGIVFTFPFNRGIPSHLFSKHTSYASSQNPGGVSWGGYGDWGGPGSTNWTAVEQDLQNMQKAGVTWIRTEIHQSDPTSVIDQEVSLLQQYNMQTEFLLKENCVSVTPSPSPSPSPSLTPMCVKALGSQTDRANYKQWVTDMVNRYKTYIHTWEIENEPNLNWFGNDGNQIDTCTTSPGCVQDPAEYNSIVGEYVQHLQDAYTAIKVADPNASLMIGGVSEYHAEEFIDALEAQGASQYFDIFAYHPYSNDGPDGVMGRIAGAIGELNKQTQMAAKPIWINEIGFYCYYAALASEGLPGIVYGPNPPSPAPTPECEQTRADYLTSIMQNIRSGYTSPNGSFTTPALSTPIVWYDLHEYQTTDPGYGLEVKDPNTLTTTYLTPYSAYTTFFSVSPSPKSSPSNSPSPSPTSSPTPTPSPACPSKKGDFDSDGVVNLTDLSIFASSYGTSAPNIPNPCTDLNGDGKVDLTDLSLFAAVYGK